MCNLLLSLSPPPAPHHPLGRFYIYIRNVCAGQETLCEVDGCKFITRFTKTINPCKSKTYRGIRWE